MNNNLIQQCSIKVWCQCAAFVQDKKGASGIEYAIVATIVAVVLGTFISTTDIGAQIKGVFTSISTSLPAVPAG